MKRRRRHVEYRRRAHAAARHKRPPLPWAAAQAAERRLKLLLVAAPAAVGAGDGGGARGRRAARLEPQVHEARVVVVHRHLSPWAALGVKSIGDLGTWKFAAAVHAIATLAACEASDVSQHK